MPDAPVTYQEEHSPSLLEYGFDAVSGVVYDNIDAAKGSKCVLDALLNDFGAIGDIELDES